ncbi:MAG: hypothetical protein ACOCVH_02035 [Verrucomicrobiota bacterium]
MPDDAKHPSIRELPTVRIANPTPRVKDFLEKHGFKDNQIPRLLWDAMRSVLPEEEQGFSLAVPDVAATGAVEVHKKGEEANQ